MKWLREKDVAEKLSLSVTGLKLLIARDAGFPKSVCISPRHKVWEENEIEQWMRGKMITDNQEVKHVQSERIA